MRILILLMLISLAACSSLPSSDEALSRDLVAVPEIADTVTSVTNTTDFSPKTPTINAPNEANFNLWWRYTGSQELETLIDRAITNSQVLQMEAQRVVQAKARYIQAGAESMPTITAEAGYSKEVPANIGTVPRGQRPRGKDEYQVSLAGNYTLDLWGQRKSLRESADLKLKQAVFQYDAQLLNLISDLAKSYFQYLSLNDRIANTEETELALESMLLAMEDRYKLGDASIIEMQIQRSAIFSTRTQLPNLLKERQQLHFEIASILGIAPESLKLSNQGLNSVALPEGVQGISTAHLLRRPDIRTVESGMLAADADLDVARKALLPGLTLAGDIGTGANKPADLFQPNTLIWNALATLSATIFDGGHKEQEVKYAQAVRNELVEIYVNTVYNGLNTARSSIAELEYNGQRLAIQKKSTRAAKLAQDFGFESYSLGGMDFLTFLDSIESYQNRQDALYTLQLDYYQAFVDFYSALGGGIPYREINNINPVFKDAPAEKNTVNNSYLHSSDNINFLEMEQLSSGWLKQPKTFAGKPWLVKLTGVYDKFAVESLIRDLPRRYNSLQPAKDLIVENIDVNISTPLASASWYSVTFTGFEQEQAAMNWCQMLRSNQQRCLVYQPKQTFKYVGKFNIAEIEKLAAELAAVNKVTEQQKEVNKIQQVYRNYISEKSPPKPKIALKDLGLIYSVIKIEGSQAYIIHNRTFKVERVALGGILESQLVVKKIDRDKLILTAHSQDYLLRPIYQVANVKQSFDGQLFAHINWGQRGEFYYHRVGDRLYGGGIIKAINEQEININWQGIEVKLPVLGLVEGAQWQDKI